jgi:hypothetical protein
MTELRSPIDSDADLEVRLRRSFEGIVAPAAPEALVARIARLAETPRPRWVIRPSLAIAALAVVVSLALVGGVLSLGSSLQSSVLASASPTSSVGRCEVTASILHGTWWQETGGPNAFFQWDEGPRPAGPNAWLIHVRFDPDAGPGRSVSVWADRLGSAEREQGSLDGRVDPRSIYRFDSQAPDLPGGWYLFEQRLPTAGCWRLSAMIDERVVGTAVVEVGPIAPPPSLASDAPTPTGPTTVRIGEWSASCRDVPPDICKGVVTLALNNLGRTRPTAALVVQDRPICPPVPVWADGTHCWQVYVPINPPPGYKGVYIYPGTICMVIARRSTDGLYAQIAGDVLGRPTLPGASPGCP